MDAPHDYFDEPVAATYDDDSTDEFSTATIAATVDVLAALAGAGSALELAIGTGRIAVPLAERGVPVVGIDLSEAMVARLRAKRDDIPVTVGDIATTRVDGTFSLVYLVFNTVMNLLTQDAQVACFRNAAAQLDDGGVFVVECLVPDLRLLPPGATVVPFHVSDDRYGFDEYDVARQGVVSHHLALVDGEWTRASIPFRYVWPAELDLMAAMAGMRLRERWAGWDGAPFTSESRSHVSVWEKVPAAVSR
jgi:SAM-dependent methyltransferase